MFFWHGLMVKKNKIYAVAHTDISTQLRQTFLSVFYFGKKLANNIWLQAFFSLRQHFLPAPVWVQTPLVSANVDDCTVITVQLFVLGVKYGQMTSFHCSYIFRALGAIFRRWVAGALVRMKGKRQLPLTGLESEAAPVKGKAMHAHNRNTHASCLINLNDRAR